MAPTVGETMMRISLDKEGSGTVHAIKRQTAEAINICAQMRDEPQLRGDSGAQRLISLALTQYEVGALYAVKAATAPPSEPVLMLNSAQGYELQSGAPATFGEAKVRVDWNPSGSDWVKRVKGMSAKLINLCKSMETAIITICGAEAAEAIKDANKAYELAAMYAVKAATMSEA